MSDSFVTTWTIAACHLHPPHPPAQLFCPWDFPGRNTGLSCHFLLRGIFPDQGLKPCFLHWLADSFPLSLAEPLWRVCGVLQTLACGSHPASPPFCRVWFEHCYAQASKLSPWRPNILQCPKQSFLTGPVRKMFAYPWFRATISSRARTDIIISLRHQS